MVFVWDGMALVWYGMVWYGIVRYGMICYVMLCVIIWYGISMVYCRLYYELVWGGPSYLLGYLRGGYC